MAVAPRSTTIRFGKFAARPLWMPTPASHRAVPELKNSGETFYQKMRVRSCPYLNFLPLPQ